MSIPFVHPSTFLISGPTGSGKTAFVRKVLVNGLIQPVPEHITWCYGEWQPLYDDMEIQMPQITFVHGVPEDIYDAVNRNYRNLIVLDDQMSEAGDRRVLANLFTKGSHHRNLSVIYIVQNLFDQGRQMRTVSLNTQYLVLFKNPRDKTQIATMGRQMFPTQSNFLVEAFEDATAEPYGYLLVDLRPETDEEMRVRSKIMPGERTVVYSPR